MRLDIIYLSAGVKPAARVTHQIMRMQKQQEEMTPQSIRATDGFSKTALSICTAV